MLLVMNADSRLNVRSVSYPFQTHSFCNFCTLLLIRSTNFPAVWAAKCSLPETFPYFMVCSSMSPLKIQVLILLQNSLCFRGPLILCTSSNLIKVICSCFNGLKLSLSSGERILFGSDVCQLLTGPPKSTRNALRQYRQPSSTGVLRFLCS